MIKIFWTLLIIILIAPLGLAIDSNHELASSTNAALELITGENSGAIDLASSSNPVQWDYLESNSINSENGSRNYSRFDVNELFNTINYDALDFEDGLNSNNIIMHNTYGDDIRISSTYVAREISSSFRYIYDENNCGEATLSRCEDLGKDISSNLHDIYAKRDSLYDDRAASKNLNSDKGEIPNYYYEKNNNEYILMPTEDTARKINSNFNYIYGKNYAPLHTSQREVRTGVETDLKEVKLSRTDKDLPDNPYLSALPNIKYIRESSVSGPNNRDASSIEADINVNLNSLVQDNLNIYEIPFKINTALINVSRIKKFTPLDAKNHAYQNYAVVVGIDHYSDRSDLHTCVNDADTMAALLEAYGYNVVKLTDQTNDKPTKENILKKALNDLKHKKDPGKLLIYFSGHGEKLGDDYYLIPQDGNGKPTSYISAEELEKGIQGLKSLVLVVDACNSGELEKVANIGQMILVSSQKDQPSNEVWFGSLSLFTYNLCKAMREEDKSSNAVVLQRCFYKAREATEKWSSLRLLAQTPQMKDKTVGYFSLK